MVIVQEFLNITDALEHFVQAQSFNKVIFKSLIHCKSAVYVYITCKYNKWNVCNIMAPANKENQVIAISHNAESGGVTLLYVTLIKSLL